MFRDGVIIARRHLNTRSPSHDVALRRHTCRRIDTTSYWNGVVFARRRLDTKLFSHDTVSDTVSYWHDVVWTRRRIDTTSCWRGTILALCLVGTTLFCIGIVLTHHRVGTTPPFYDVVWARLRFDTASCDKTFS